MVTAAVQHRNEREDLRHPRLSQQFVRHIHNSFPTANTQTVKTDIFHGSCGRARPAPRGAGELPSTVPYMFSSCRLRQSQTRKKAGADRVAAKRPTASSARAKDEKSFRSIDWDASVLHNPTDLPPELCLVFSRHFGCSHRGSAWTQESRQFQAAVNHGRQWVYRVQSDVDRLQCPNIGTRVIPTSDLARKVPSTLPLGVPLASLFAV